MRILGIDPGTEKSGFVVWDNGVAHADTVENNALRVMLREHLFGGNELCAIEMVACYGMAVGAEVFHTVLWIGRFMERSRAPVRLVYRRDIKLHLCGTARAKDANVRQALIDKHGKVGTAKNKGPLYGVKGHLWSALAVCDYAAETAQPS